MRQVGQLLSSARTSKTGLVHQAAVLCAKRGLGYNRKVVRLDDERSWVMLDEVNQFGWPGYDIRHVPGSTDRFAYGFIPPKLYDTIIGRMLELAAARRVVEIRRD